MGHHLRRTFHHRCLDGSTQFPPTVGQPERLAAGNWRGQAKIHRKVRLSIQFVEASGHGASKQRLAAWRVAVPPAESPNLLTLSYLCLAPSLKPGRDVLGSNTAHRMTSLAYPRMKLCGQQWWMMQQVDIPCPCPKFVPGLPNLTRPGAPLCAAADPLRPQSRPGRPKYLTAQPVALLLAENSPTSRPQHYSGQHRQDIKVKTKPHSQTLAVSVKDIKTFAQPLVLLDLPHAETSSPTRYPSFCRFLYFSRAGPIQTRPSGHRHASFPAKVANCCRRVLGCHPLPGCLEEELGRT